MSSLISVPQIYELVTGLMTTLPWIPSAAGSGGNAHNELYDYDALVSYGSSGCIVLTSEAGTVSNRDGYEVCGVCLLQFPFLSSGYSAGRCGCSGFTKKNQSDTQKKRRKGRSMFLEHGEDIPSCFWVLIFILIFMVIDFVVSVWAFLNINSLYCMWV